MRQRWLFVALIVALCFLLVGRRAAGSQKAEDVPTSSPINGVGLPNPASAYCQEQGYKHEIRTAAEGGQSGVCIFPDGSECDEWAFYRGECSPTPSVAPAAAASLWLDKTEVQPGEEIQVHFATPATFPVAAWVGIIPSDVPHGSEATNDEYDLAYEYLSGRVSGVLTFFAPDKPGSYDLRLHDTDDDGQEVAPVTFQVTGQ